MATLEQKLDVALWWKQMRETNNARFLHLLFDKHRFLVLKGGGGSGKSIFAGRKILERVTNEPGHRYLVVRKVAKTLRESCFEQLKKQAYEYYADQIAFIPKGKGSDMYIRFKNGSEILFAGLDDVEKLKSIFDITGIWIEEASELEEGDFNQLDIRLRTEFPFYLQMILTFNPISITHWLKKRFFDTKDPRATVHESTYKDNRFLTPEARITLEAFRETDEYYYMVYCLGQWGVTGKTVFNGKAVAERLTYVEKQGWRKRGYFAYTLSPDDIHISALCPLRQLLNRCRTECIRRRNNNFLAAAFKVIRKLSYSGRLTCAVYAYNKYNSRLCIKVKLIVALENFCDYLLQKSLYFRRVGSACSLYLFS